jgi:hypothetical protein
MPRRHAPISSHIPTSRRTQTGRIAKNKAKATIHEVTAPFLRGPGTAPILADSILIQEPPHVADPNISAPGLDIVLLNALTTRLEGYESGLDALKSTIRENQIESRQANVDTFSQLMERLDNLGTAPAERSQAGIQLPAILTGTLPPSTDAVNVPSRWSWIDLSTTESIANGLFEINSLPKLHRDAELRHQHLAKNFETFSIPLDGSKPELISGRTKMQSAFRDLSTFLSAWLIYISVRTSYSPERGPGLASWTERLVFLSQCGYHWSTILNYAIAYYGDHQNSSPETWFKVDGELIANHFGIVQQRPTVRASSKPAPTSGSSSGPSKNMPIPELPISLQICLNYNRNRCAAPCRTGRRHVCGICAKEHQASACPLAKPST